MSDVTSAATAELSQKSGAWTARRIALHTALLAAVLIVYQFTPLDVWVQNRIFDRAGGRWPISMDHEVLHRVFYSAPDVGLAAFGVVCIGILITSIWRPAARRHRRFAALVVLSLTLVPGTISTLKTVTNCYTPDRCELFDGKKPYVRAFESYPPGFVQENKPHGWPAGHASGGFALMVLAFACGTQRKRRLGLALGLTLGWVTGVFQMLRGQHYLSDNLVTMEVAWIEILVLQWVVDAVARRRTP